MDEKDVNLTEWERRSRRNDNFKHSLKYLATFIENSNNPWHLYSGLKLMLGYEKAQEIADLLEI